MPDGLSIAQPLSKVIYNRDEAIEYGICDSGGSPAVTQAFGIMYRAAYATYHRHVEEMQQYWNEPNEVLPMIYAKCA